MLAREMLCSGRGMMAGWAGEFLSSKERPLALVRGWNERIILLSLRDVSLCSLRLVAQDTALSRREQGFETPRERHQKQGMILSLSLG